MDNDHPRLHEFRVRVGSPSHDLPVCREVTYSLTVIGNDGAIIEREHSAIEYGDLLSDPDQVPWLIAHALRSLLQGKSTPKS